MLNKDLVDHDLSDEVCELLPASRHKTYVVKVGQVKIGGNNPIVVQSMALGVHIDSDNVKSSAKRYAKEIIELAHAGSELVRIALNSEEVARAVPYIVEEINKEGFDGKILVGCGQYELDKLVRNYPDNIKMLGKIRINPGNIGFGDKHDEKFERVIEYAITHDIPVRIGVNWGSLDKYLLQKLMDENSLSNNPKSSDVILRKALVMSALNSAQKAEEIGLSLDKIVISCKVSRVQDLISVYTALAKSSNYALHLGLTEAGTGNKGMISTTAGLTYLLQNGIGDTIRASLTQRPGEPRVNEVAVCQEILQSIGLRHFNPQVNSCPGCGRTNSDRFRILTEEVNDYIKIRMPTWKKKNPGVEHMNIAVMGCIVNGPGESKHANLGISLPGYGEKPISAVYKDGKYFKTLQGDNIFEEFKAIIDDYVKEHYT
ncbi:flavodoxin-dependent (E)-4-hydroxy-3-methylbut-2-enyl-diphosphate synthase [Wolbachia endosymbiont of Brugia malayi]|uniref:4-hydroxy-3-methylbut-2-en-1-yl diphosphate synthase (flavodoxin) n=1 Tax=Wolbachia sp. subsp. Brugia malayi (strain TRS) TaxID=292805 RepID=ISPG_WOLTR|nr:flavodoxin-dependent (E)-4-hydroxy-3-methylbut-2-enyl-diphosphate synthase [Wolbachia endosymbiont of Brugia malayi]Q5GRK4.1 RecName: Full=4-hydroxy-3-methylbut-2-en-1-yl diphosphate synthase (flavodoxin); AltName: Full=1-hydroxy-2-methyl-2-(E)-butenyl 4-diphosphate synthase [Wolbachia endosymbiont strain TRS of Brugia malayi]AAW71370.1 1-hydroxy-2-methyl-2-(e)-butenyl 4-diphosphate synthase [Wolbachia endosymbiont strain TRS of Brugia malayi]QCB61558.1 flavodoxin-dependent (E)-4-hydroxy-3-me